MSVIPTTQEVEIWRIAIQGQWSKMLIRPHLYQQDGCGGVNLWSQLLVGIEYEHCGPSPAPDKTLRFT
jgi:hypothetical protein